MKGLAGPLSPSETWKSNHVNTTNPTAQILPVLPLFEILPELCYWGILYANGFLSAVNRFWIQGHEKNIISQILCCKMKTAYFTRWCNNWVRRRLLSSVKWQNRWGCCGSCNKIRLQDSLFSGSPPRVWEQVLCVLFNRSLQRGSFMTGSLTTHGRWKAGLLGICSSAGGGVGMC